MVQGFEMAVRGTRDNVEIQNIDKEPLVNLYGINENKDHDANIGKQNNRSYIWMTEQF